MAAIGKIREQSTLLLILIGGAMVAFILGDILSNRSTGSGDRYVGSVFGEEINLVDYERRVEAQKESMASIGQPISSEAEQQIRNQVWNNMVQEKVMYAEMNKLGLRIGQDEFDDIRFGDNLRPEFMSDDNFKDPQTGQFDPKLVQNYFAFLKERYPLFYENQVNRIVNERLYEKYNTMVREGLYVTTIEAKDDYYRQDQKVRFQYVMKPYDAIADSTIAVTDGELKAFYEKHKDEERFDRQAQVDIKYTVWSVSATPEDEEVIKADLAELKQGFAEADNDSLYVLRFAATRNGAPMDLQTKENAELAAMVETANEGDVIGPYKEGNRYAIAKIVKKGTEELATVRHILLSKSTEPDVEKLKARADSLKKVIQKQNNFEAMVTAFSEDPGSVQTGGRYERFDDKTMVPEFTEVSFKKAIGSINVVETDYGVHLVEPLERVDVPKLTAFVVDQTIEPSNQTFDRAYDEANEFSIAAKDVEGMIKMAEEKALEVKESKELQASSRTIPGVTNSSDAVFWAHNSERSKVGKLSEPFEFGNQVVVVGLVNRKASGIAKFEDVKEEIKPEVILEKKKAILKEEMTGKTLEDLVASGLTQQVAMNVSEKTPSLPSGSSEPYVVGYALTMSEGDQSTPLVGNRGVYVVKLESKVTVEPKETYDSYRDALSEAAGNAIKTYNAGVYRALKDMAKVKDERSNFY